ncbi:unnamed protein product, partial [Thlaspi arvense]
GNQKTLEFYQNLQAEKLRKHSLNRGISEFAMVADMNNLSSLSEEKLKDLKKLSRFLDISNFVVSALAFLIFWSGGLVPIPLSHKLGVYGKYVWNVVVLVVIVTAAMVTRRQTCGKLDSWKTKY